MDIADQYARAVWDAEHMLATWTPDAPLRVGDVVVRDPAGALRVECTLSSVVDSPLPPVAESSGALSTLLHRGISVESAAEGEAEPGAAHIKFDGSKSFVFVGARSALRSFQTLAEVRRGVLEAASNDRWQRNWHVVTAVRAFAAATVLVAQSQSVQALVQIAGTPTVASLATLRAGARISVTSGTAAAFSLGPCTPFYEAIRIRQRLGRPPSAQASTLDGSVQEAVREDIADEVVRVSLEESGLISRTVA